MMLKNKATNRDLLVVPQKTPCGLLGEPQDPGWATLLETVLLVSFGKYLRTIHRN